MRTIYFLTVILTFLAFNLTSCAPVAKTNQELQALAADPNSKIIHTVGDFDQKSKKGFLKKVSPSVLQAFRDSLLFKNGGLAGADVSAISTVLSRRQFRRLIGYFGIGEVLLEDYKEHWCESLHTCGPKDRRICTWLCAF